MSSEASYANEANERGQVLRALNETEMQRLERNIDTISRGSPCEPDVDVTLPQKEVVPPHADKQARCGYDVDRSSVRRNNDM